MVVADGNESVQKADEKCRDAQMPSVVKNGKESPIDPAEGADAKRDIEHDKGAGSQRPEDEHLIVDGFHVGVGNSHFIIPLDMVVECIELPPDVGDMEYLEQRNEALPFIRLREIFGEQGPAHARPRVIVVRFGRRRAGLVVDRIYGKCQTVIKPLGPLFAEVPAVSGSTIIGNGEVGMILDVPALVRLCAGAARRKTPAMAQPALLTH